MLPSPSMRISSKPIRSISRRITAMTSRSFEEKDGVRTRSERKRTVSLSISFARRRIAS